MAGRNPLVAHRVRHPLNAISSTPATAAVETLVGHRFARADLLREALTHRSALVAKRSSRGKHVRATGAGSNERLEFVGDRVLGLLVAEWLIERYPAEQEGRLGARLSTLVAQPALAAIAERLGLAELITVAEGESRAGVRTLPSVLADAVEALLGALYLDGGLEPARQFVRRAWAEAIETQAEPPKDPKTALQEWLLARGRPLPEYVVLSRAGPSHEPLFVVEARAGELAGTGSAGSKQMAERRSAAALLETLKA